MILNDISSNICYTKATLSWWGDNQLENKFTCYNSHLHGIISQNKCKSFLFFVVSLQCLGVCVITLTRGKLAMPYWETVGICRIVHKDTHHGIDMLLHQSFPTRSLEHMICTVYMHNENHVHVYACSQCQKKPIISHKTGVNAGLVMSKITVFSMTSITKSYLLLV